MLRFDPSQAPHSSKLRVRKGTEYIRKCDKLNEVHQKRAEGSFSLNRSMEDVERARIPESRQERLFEPAMPLPLRAPGLPIAISSKSNFMATKSTRSQRTFVPPHVNANQQRYLTGPQSCQQPDIPYVFYQVASPLILPGLRPLTPGGGPRPHFEAGERAGKRTERL